MELSRIPRYLKSSLKNQTWSMSYVPQVGYLVQINGNPIGADLLDILDDYKLVCKISLVNS